MDACRFLRMPRANREKLCSVAAVCCLLLLSTAGRIAQAEVRDSVKRALPATVGVEWRDATDKSASPKAASPAGEYKAAVANRIAATLHSVSANQLNMASGTLVSADGLIVTMIGSHEDGQYSVTLADGRTMPARLLVDDRRSGLQLLKIDAAGLPFLSISNQPAQIGEDVTWTYCLDLKDRAAARGMIAATGREVKGMADDLLQLDSGVALMSAGAPLVDEPGRLVGIIAYLRSGGSQRTGFAIPVSAVEALLAARKGDDSVVVKRGMLGVYLTPDGKEGSNVIAHPISDSPAAAAGVRDGDEILSVDGKKVDSLKLLGRLVGARAAGQKIRLTIRREGREEEIEATLAPAPAQAETPPIQPPQPAPAGAPNPAVTVVKPDSLYVLDVDGKLQALSGATEKYRDALREYYTRFKKGPGATALDVNDALINVPSIRVERSNLEKKLEEISRDVQSLRQQMEKLTEELKRVQKP
jgi:S1-C subfamily serine protease